MNHINSLLNHIMRSLELWSPMQLLGAAAATILLGYFGLVSSRIVAR